MKAIGGTPIITPDFRIAVESSPVIYRYGNGAGFRFQLDSREFLEGYVSPGSSGATKR